MTKNSVDINKQSR